MNNEDMQYRKPLQALNEKFKSEFLGLVSAESVSAKAVNDSSYGCITSEALTLMQRALSPNMLRHLMNRINSWLEDELSYLDCEWDEIYMRKQKERLFSILSDSNR